MSVLPSLLLPLFVAVAAADPAARVAGAGFDVERYRFELVLSDADDVVRGVAELVGRLTEEGRRELVLDLVGPDGAEGAPSATGMTVERAWWLGPEGAAVAAIFRQEGDLLSFALPSPSRRESGFALRVEYHGVPADGLIIGTNRYGERTFFGDNWPDRARHWLPSVDHPRDKALVDFVVTAPAHYQVVANGVLREETDLGGGLRRTHWSSREPLPTKVMVIGVARFAVEHLDPISGVPVQSWVFPPDRDAGLDEYRVAAEVLPVLEEILGPFPYPKLANVQSTTRYGGMENAGAVFYSERTVNGERDDAGLFAHELAHQWWGDAVTESDWAHAWISEGFATYFAQVYFERTEGAPRLAAGMAAAREQVVRWSRGHPERTVVDDRRPARDMLDANTYQKGAWVLHMLRGEVGDGPFFLAVRALAERYRHRNASTDDVRRVFEEMAGRELGWFFDQWLLRPGQPRLSVRWGAAPGSAEALQVVVCQTQEAPPFVAGLELGLVGEDGALQVETVPLRGRETTATLVPRSPARAVVLDPGVRLLMEPGEVVEVASADAPGRRCPER